MAEKEQEQVQEQQKSIYQLGLHEHRRDDLHTVVRVPGGWIYHSSNLNGVATSVFVPFNQEFNDNPGKRHGL